MCSFIMNLIALHHRPPFCLKQPLTLCHCGVRVHWSFDSPERLLCLCQHLVEMTLQTSRSSQMKPRADNGSWAWGAHRHPEVERWSTDLAYHNLPSEGRGARRFNLVRMGSLEMLASTRQRLWMHWNPQVSSIQQTDVLQSANAEG